ncbi:hypothetical protein EV421DRAFT_2021408 [Armillaria borealis]|uniref:Uncharacterized protein n=1 Tax=Armillaria borealis TaxID=47425 RepID=A0AA39J9Q5_9AGAR|nr:hypothetical protein EV421DRAFT_2021408 [Armillaria borealis]
MSCSLMVSLAYIPPPLVKFPSLSITMITNNQFIQTICYLFAVAIATALLVTVFVKDLLAFVEVWAWSTKTSIMSDHRPITVMVKVEVTTTHYSTVGPLHSVSSDCALVEISSECYSGT